jgi:hypothetical protein
MTTLARRISLCLAATAMLACTDRSALEQRAAAPSAQRLVGTWDVSISRADGGGGQFLMSRHREQ